MKTQQGSIFYEVKKHLGKFVIIIMILLLGAVFTFIEPEFISPTNLKNIIRQAAVMIVLTVFYRLVVLMIDGKELGNISNIQRFSVHDGPGIRTVVFLLI